MRTGNEWVYRFAHPELVLYLLWNKWQQREYCCEWMPGLISWTKDFFRMVNSALEVREVGGSDEEIKCGVP